MALVLARIQLDRPGRVLLIILATLCISAALIFAYTAFLSHEDVPGSAVALSAVLLASTVSSIAGFAFSAVCGAMLLRIMNDPVQVVEVMIVSSIAIQSVSVVALRHDIDWRSLLPFLAGGLIGLPFGLWLLLHLHPLGFKEAVGVLLTAYATYALFKRPVVLAINRKPIDVFIGFLGGITGGLVAFPGAPVTVWCGMKGWDKRRQRGIYQPFILVMQILALGLLAVMRGPVARGASHSFHPLQFVPAALLGTWFGLAIFKRLSDQSFTRLVNVLLLVSGIGLVL
jgi:uncharacterized membrane protein YfcA